MLPKNQNRILHVVPKQKELPYTITPIGDKIALERWKVDQIIKEEEYQAKMAPIRVERAKEVAEIVAMNKTTRPLTYVEQAEIKYCLSLVKSNHAARVQKIEYDSYAVTNKTWLENIKDSIKSAISDTFFKH